MICDATSAAFAMELPWDKLDVVTWSWQKVLGGEAAHGMLALSPRAVGGWRATPRLAAAQGVPHDQRRPLSAGIFRGDTINTPSMLCVEDALDGLRWAERHGGLPALVARSEANLAAVAGWVARTPWAEFLAADPAMRSCTSICLRIPPLVRGARPRRAGRAVKRWPRCWSGEGVAFDIASYRDAPPGLRIWGGATVETADIEALLPWLDWAQWAVCRARFARASTRRSTRPDLPAPNPALLPSGLLDLLPPEAETEAAAVGRVDGGVRRAWLRAGQAPAGGVRGRAAGRHRRRHAGPDLPPHGPGHAPHDGRARGHDAAGRAHRRHAHAPRPRARCGCAMPANACVCAAARSAGPAGGAGGHRADRLDTPAADAEMVLLAAEALDALGLTRVSFDLTLPPLAPALLDDAGITGPQRQALAHALDRKDAAAVAQHGGPLAGLLTDLLLSAGPAGPALDVLDRGDAAACRRGRHVPAAARDRAGHPGPGAEAAADAWTRSSSAGSAITPASA